MGIYRTNPDGKILMANPTLIRMMGYASFDEFYAVKSFRKSCEPTYLSKKIKDRLEREGRVRGFEAKWKIGRNGAVMYVRENARAIRDAEGKTLYYEGTVEDISETKQAEERIDQYQTAAPVPGIRIDARRGAGKKEDIKPSSRSYRPAACDRQDEAGAHRKLHPR